MSSIVYRPIFKKADSKTVLKPPPHHVACIAIMISTDTDLMAFKLRANGMQIINVTKKENLIVDIDAIIPILGSPKHVMLAAKDEP